MNDQVTHQMSLSSESFDSDLEMQKALYTAATEGHYKTDKNPPGEFDECLSQSSSESENHKHHVKSDQISKGFGGVIFSSIPRKKHTND